jgi:hypothetical protein
VFELMSTSRFDFVSLNRSQLCAGGGLAACEANFIVLHSLHDDRHKSWG